MRSVDANVLLYAVGRSPTERGKRQAALEILDSHDLVLSVQVLQEFYVQATRPTRADRLSHGQALLLLESFRLRFPVEETTVALFFSALETASRFKISYGDAAVVEAARAAGYRTVLSEGLKHGQDFDGVRIEDPFRSRTERTRR